MMYRILTLVIVLGLLACGGEKKKEAAPVKRAAPVMAVLPLGHSAGNTANYIAVKLRAFYPNVVLKPAEMLPAFALNGGRYRADSLIRWMRDRATTDEVYVGITHNDISTTKNEHADWGVLGLGYQPGRACVVSTHRIKKKTGENIFKVVVHEIGHTRGLPHCADERCYMADAKGKDPTEKETGFCAKCSQVLREQGWKL